MDNHSKIDFKYTNFFQERNATSAVHSFECRVVFCFRMMNKYTVGNKKRCISLEILVITYYLGYHWSQQNMLPIWRLTYDQHKTSLGLRNTYQQLKLSNSHNPLRKTLFAFLVEKETAAQMFLPNINCRT